VPPGAPCLHVHRDRACSQRRPAARQWAVGQGGRASRRHGFVLNVAHRVRGRPPRADGPRRALAGGAGAQQGATGSTATTHTPRTHATHMRRSRRIASSSSRRRLFSSSASSNALPLSSGIPSRILLTFGIKANINTERRVSN